MIVSTVNDFKTNALREWGDVRRTHTQLFDRKVSLIQDWVEFSTASVELKVVLAETILRESTPLCGAIAENGDANWFISNFAREISVIDPPFDSRRVTVMKAALLLLSYRHFNLFTSPANNSENEDLKLIFGLGGSGLASIYILSQIEYLFRVNSTYLDIKGKIKKPIPVSLASKPGLKGKKINDYVNQIQSAFLLYLEAKPDPLSVILSQLETDLSLSNRLPKIRNSAVHGELGDPSSEGVFYALLLAMFYYSHSFHTSTS